MNTIDEPSDIMNKLGVFENDYISISQLRSVKWDEHLETIKKITKYPCSSPETPLQFSYIIRSLLSAHELCDKKKSPVNTQNTQSKRLETVYENGEVVGYKIYEKKCMNDDEFENFINDCRDAIISLLTVPIDNEFN